MSGPYIALYRGTSLLSRLIKWRTWGAYSHASWVTEGATEIEAWHVGGVREVDSIGKDHRKGTAVDLFRVKGIEPGHIGRAEKFLRQQVGKPYDYWGILGFLARTAQGRGEKRWFCSELVFEALRRAGVELLRDIPAHKVSPSCLATSPGLEYVGSVVTGDEQKPTGESAMKKVAAVLMVTILALLSSGCATDKTDINKILADYYAQPRTYAALKVSGVRELTISGENIELAMEAPLNPLSAMPQDPNRTMMFLDAAKNIALGGMGIWALNNIANRPATVVRQPAPLVVRPEIITVPSE